MGRWLSAFFGAALGGAACVLGLWGALLLIDPAETRRYDVAIPALGLSGLGLVAAVVLLRR